MKNRILAVYFIKNQPIVIKRTKKYMKADNIKKFFAIPRCRLARSNGLEKRLFLSQKNPRLSFLSLILSIN